MCIPWDQMSLLGPSLGREPFPGTVSHPINLSPTRFQKAGGPARECAGPDKAALCRGGPLTTRAALAHPPPCLPFAKISQIKTETKPQMLFAMFPPQ